MNEMLPGVVRRMMPLLGVVVMVGCGSDEATAPQSMAERVEGVYTLARVEASGINEFQIDVPGCETVPVPIVGGTYTICAQEGSLTLTAEDEVGGSYERSVVLEVEGQQEGLEESGTFQVAGEATALWFDLTLDQSGGTSTWQADARADGTEIRLEADGLLQIYVK